MSLYLQELLLIYPKIAFGLFRVILHWWLIVVLLSTSITVFCSNSVIYSWRTPYLKQASIFINLQDHDLALCTVKFYPIPITTVFRGARFFLYMSIIDCIDDAFQFVSSANIISTFQSFCAYGIRSPNLKTFDQNLILVLNPKCRD